MGLIFGPKQMLRKIGKRRREPVQLWRFPGIPEGSKQRCELFQSLSCQSFRPPALPPPFACSPPPLSALSLPAWFFAEEQFWGEMRNENGDLLNLRIVFESTARLNCQLINAPELKLLLVKTIQLTQLFSSCAILRFSALLRAFNLKN